MRKTNQEVIMSRLFYLLVCVFILSGMNNLWAQTTYSWIGGSGNWSVAANWSPNGVPTAADNVLITADGTYTVTLDVDTTITDISIGGASGVQTLSLSNRTLTIIGDGAVNNNGVVSLSNSTISGNGTLTNSGSLITYSGTLDMDFDNYGSATFRYVNTLTKNLTTHPNSTIHIHVNTTNNTLTIANGFTNHGLIYFTNAAGYTSRGAIDLSSGTLLNASDGTIGSDPVTLYPGYANSILAPLDNQGKILLNNSMNITKPDESHINSGEIQLNNATISFTGNQLENTTTGGIGGNGTLNVKNLAFVNNGSFIPGDSPGILNVQNDLPSAATAFLNFELGGPVRGEFYNSLAIAQTANFNGTLNIELTDGYVPNVGQEFILTSHNSQNGTFLVRNGLEINAWKEFKLYYEENQLKLVTEAISDLTSPFAYDDFSTADDGTEILIDVTRNDTDPDGEVLTLVSVGPADHGTTQVGPNNLVSYKADSSYAGEDKFIYTIENESGCRTSGLVTVTVNPAIPETPQLAFPADSSTGVDANVILSWYYNALIDSYQVQISDIPTFNGGNELLYTGIVDTFLAVTLPAEGTKYWRVLSQNAAGKSAWSVTWNFTTDTNVGIEDESALPLVFSLNQNYPNPFNPSTTIEFSIPETEFTTLKVFNTLGQEVAVLVSNKLNRGKHTYTFNAQNLASGIYYYLLVAGDYRAVKKLTLLK